MTDYDSVAPEVHMATSDLQWLTSMINPIVYAAMNTQFRKEYKKYVAFITNRITASVWILPFPIIAVMGYDLTVLRPVNCDFKITEHN